MIQCGFGSCKYKTQKSERMRDHRDTHGHHPNAKPQKQFRGDRAQQHQKRRKK